VRWTWQLVRDGLESALRHHPGVRSSAPDLEKAVLAGELTPALAAHQLLQTFLAAPDTAPPADDAPADAIRNGETAAGGTSSRADAGQ
jgi:LAO/AO transport system kinase